MNDRKWQNWDIADVASSINTYWHTSTNEKEWRNILIADMKSAFSQKSTILEIGCGSGLIYNELCKKKIVTLKSYHGGDISQKMLSIAKSQYPKAKFDTLDIFNLPFADQSQPNVICIQVLQHLPSYEEAIKELIRICGNKLHLVSWFNNEEADSIIFSEIGFGNVAFYNNKYSLAKFLHFIYTHSNSRIKQLICTKLTGFTYSITIVFDNF